MVIGEQNSRPRILLLTGERQVGKSTALERAVDLMRQAGLTVSGLMTKHVGPQDLDVHELHSGAVYRLTDPTASLRPKPGSRYGMDPQAMARSVRALHASVPTGVFIVDELGPLEFRKRQGWVDALSLLERESYRLAVLVVRPSLLEQAIMELPAVAFEVVRVTVEARDRVPEIVAGRAVAAVTGQPSVPGRVGGA